MSNLKLPVMRVKSLSRIKPYGGRIGYKTDVMFNADKTRVGIYHHNSLIAVIDESGTAGHELIVSVSTAGWASRTTIDRINRVIRDNCNNANASIKNYTPYLSIYETNDRSKAHSVDISGRRFYSMIINDGYVHSIITDESLYKGVH